MPSSIKHSVVKCDKTDSNNLYSKRMETSGSEVEDGEKQSSKIAPSSASITDDRRSVGSSPDERSVPSFESASRESRKSLSMDEKPRKDRSKLRKGKWTVEEEEYTSRIIHYFSTGLLTLPEGATLRSYLAEKLNCDPMRITKKYAGASCLGRRVYHFRDRMHPTIAEIQLAKAELDHLEQRFRNKVEGGTAGPPTPSPIDIVQSLIQQATNPLMALSGQLQSQNVLQSLLLGLAVPQSGNVAQLAQPPANSSSDDLLRSLATFANATTQRPTAAPVSSSTSSQNTAQWFFPGASNQTIAGTSNISTQLLQSVDPSIAALAISQAAASLGPALTQLAAVNIQQLQQSQNQLQSQSHEQARIQAQLQEQQKELQTCLLMLSRQQPQPQQFQPTGQMSTVPSMPSLTVPILGTPANNAQDQARALLKQAFDQHVRSQGVQSSTQQTLLPVNTGLVSTSSVDQIPKVHQPCTSETSVRSEPVEPTMMPSVFQRSEEDKAAGTALLGFLNSLRQSYEAALNQKHGKSKVRGISNMDRLRNNKSRSSDGTSDSSDDTTPRNRVHTVTDSASSQQVESSVEDSDWNSDKKTDPSSSEDSDKEMNDPCCKSQGPPRKRIKTKKMDETKQSIS